MIKILFTLIFTEMALILIFVFKTPLRKAVIMGLDRVKRGQAPLVVKVVGSTIFVVMLSTLYTDQVLAARHLLEALLMVMSSNSHPTYLDEESRFKLEIKAIDLSSKAGSRASSFVVKLELDVLPCSHCCIIALRRVVYLGLVVFRVYHLPNGCIFVEFFETFFREGFVYMILRRLEFLVMISESKRIFVVRSLTCAFYTVFYTKLLPVEKGYGISVVELICHFLSILLVSRTNDRQTSPLHQRTSGVRTTFEGSNYLISSQELEKRRRRSNAESNAEADTIALKKQSEGFLLEYDRLLEDNQNLRAQLQSDQRFSNSGSKKAT
ncbi:B-cell receptor-associated protein 31-like protein [Tanacetum coccineum]